MSLPSSSNEQTLITIPKNNNRNEDCILCRLTGSLGSLAMSVYVFYNASKHAKPANRIFLNVLGTGSSSFHL